MTELDKFKRRTIRSVSRMLQQKKPPDELWGQMKKELGTDCRVLWERMRALCIKKLNRMLAVDDRSDTLPIVARLTLTDWLLVDLVLVHEEIDVIAMEKEDNKAEQKPLVELFNLVQRFEVEGRCGEPLAEAWAAATVFYNRQGRQCSPMLLQRRWYQLKKVTRCRFYKFWHSYRGNTRLLDVAKATMPSRLQMAVAKRYPSVITQPFPEWEELIKERLIIMPEEFEAKMRLPNLPKPCKSNDPDLVVVEPLIETIDLRVDSEPEDEAKDDNDVDTSDPEKSNDATQVKDKGILGIKIKTEPIEEEEEDGLSNVQLVAATHVPEVDIADDDNLEPVVEPNKKTEDKEKQTDTPDSEGDLIEIPSVIPVVDIDLETPTNNAADKSQEEILETSSPDNDMPVNDNEDEVDDFIKIKADEFCSNKPNEVPEVTNVESLVDNIMKDKIDNFLNTPKHEMIIEKKPDVADILNEKSNLTAIDLMADLNFVDEGIEFVDDGVEFVEEYDEPNKETVNKTPSVQDQNEDSVNPFDLKLLMYPVVYTTRLDQMSIFSDKQFDSVENLEDIEKVVAESKPVSRKSFNINIKQEDKTSQIDVDDSGTNDDLFTNKEESSDEDIPDSARVSITSNILWKPKSRSYNPIQLCKNPDFNTKLRRLNIGFFSSTRNRMLLNACIPMTIDVSKSFESRMVDGTLYLKNTVPGVKEEPKELGDIQTPSEVPITIPVQSQLDKVLTNMDLMPTSTITTPDPIVSRKKVISLPDIEKVRKINQQLLTAQVPPIRVYAGDSHRLPQAAPVVNNPVEEIKLTEQPISTPDSEPPTIMPTVVKVKSEANLNNEGIPPRPETPPPELPPAKKKLLKIINRAKVLTQEALAKIDDGRRTSESNELKQVTFLREMVPKPKPAGRPAKTGKKCNVNQVAVPWTIRASLQRPEQIDDFLITGDTLNKMLHLMGKDTHDTNCTSCASKPKYPKKKYKKLKGKSSKSNKEDNSQIDSDGQVIARGRLLKYCCWARQKIANRKRITKHTCPPEGCICCCRDELGIRMLVQQNQQKSDAIELSDDEDVNLQKACQSIENVVQQSRDLTRRAVVIENVYGIDSDSLGLEMDLDGVAANETIIEIPAAPSNVPTLRSSVDITSVTVNLDTPNPQIKFNVQTVKTPFRVAAKPAPFRVTAEPAPRNVMDEQTLHNITTVQSPLTVAADQAPLNVAPLQTPVNVADSQTPLNVTAGHTPLNVTSLQTPLDVVAATDLVSAQTETSTLHVSQTPTLATSQPSPSFVHNIRTRIVTELPKVNPAPKPTKITYQDTSPRFVRCSCQKPAVSQDARRNIVIDASKQCSIHKPPVPLVTTFTPSPIAPKNESKVLYLNSNSLAKSPSESPIYLGKNKILLTTVKFPRKNQDVIPELEVHQAPKIIPTLEMPPGVHLVMLASGCVTYTLDQGKVLSEAEQARLPSIIAAVQEQLNSAVPSVIAPVNNDINATNTNSPNPIPEVNVNVHTTESQVPINLEAQEVFQEDELPVNVPESEDAVSIASVPVEGAVESNAIPETQSDEISHSAAKENECTPSNEATINTTDENYTRATSNDNPVVSNDTPPVSNVTSPILNEPEPVAVLETQAEKDTQEASVEDNKEAAEKDESVAKEVASNRKSLLSDLMEMSGISAEDTTVVEPPPLVQDVTGNQMSNVILDVNPELTEGGPGIVGAVLTTDQTTSLPELSPVTSFAELKYACEQNGKFFKLDYETGIIVPINVCIKKNIKRKFEEKPKAVIDLTDDVDDENDTISNSSPTAQYMYNGKTVNVAVKPVKLFKACRPSLLKRNKLLDTNIPIPRKKSHFENRKQALHKIEARIDLVDSDEPMEEEYLMDSSDDEGSLKSMHVEALDLGILDNSDDSSDDEPLAKKSKRLKESQTETAVNTIETNIRLAMDSLEENSPIPEAEDSENTSKEAVTVTPMIYEDLPSDVNNKEDNGDQPVLKFMSGASDDEGGEDDCILGV